MNFAAYPFDQHFLTVDMSTDFNASGSPSNAEAADYIVIKGKKLGPGGDTGRPSFKVLDKCLAIPAGRLLFKCSRFDFICC